MMFLYYLFDGVAYSTGEIVTAMCGTVAQVLPAAA